jgi:UDP-N-acetyl-D-mannosaminuronate dehydrogenase
VAYKKGTSQITESQQLRLAVALAQHGRTVLIRDSAEVVEQVSEQHPGLFKFETKGSVTDQSIPFKQK